MKRAAKSFSGGTLPAMFAKTLPGGRVSPQLREIARAFINLQEARHEADYNVRRRFTRRETLELIDRASNAVRTWNDAVTPEEARVFLLALLIQDRLKAS